MTGTEGGKRRGRQAFGSGVWGIAQEVGITGGDSAVDATTIMHVERTVP